MSKKIIFCVLFFQMLFWVSDAVCQQVIPHKYNVVFSVDDQHVHADVIFTPGYDLSVSNKINFKLNKSYQNIKASGRGISKVALKNTQDNTIVELQTSGKLKEIKFSYDAETLELAKQFGDSTGFMLLDEMIIPMIDSESKFDLFSFSVTLKNGMKMFPYHFINGASDKQPIQSKKPTDRLLILFSSGPFVKHHVENTNFNVYTTGKTDAARLQFIKNKTNEIGTFYNNFFCSNQIGDLDIIVNRHYSYSFFSRPDFMSLQDIEFERGIIYLLAHELAHNWFCNALIYNYSRDAFMNESFAEYSAYLYNRNTNGEAVFTELIERKQREFKDFEYSVNDVSKDLDPQVRERILYTKGALICYELEQKIGRENFKDLLCELIKNKTATITDLELLLQDKYGSETLQFFRSLL